MTIYIVSYTSFEAIDNYLYTARDIYSNYDEAFEAFIKEYNAAWESITEEGQIPGNEITLDRMERRCVFERQNGYMKIVVELTSHEI